MKVKDLKDNFKDREEDDEDDYKKTARFTSGEDRENDSDFNDFVSIHELESVGEKQINGTQFVVRAK